MKNWYAPELFVTNLIDSCEERGGPLVDRSVFAVSANVSMTRAVKILSAPEKANLSFRVVLNLMRTLGRGLSLEDLIFLRLPRKPIPGPAKDPILFKRKKGTYPTFAQFLKRVEANYSPFNETYSPDKGILQARTGLSLSHLTRILSGNNDPTLESLTMILTALELSYPELIDGAIYGTFKHADNFPWVRKPHVTLRREISIPRPFEVKTVEAPSRKRKGYASVYEYDFDELEPCASPLDDLLTPGDF